MNKRILSSVLALAMVASMGVTAFATENSTTVIYNASQNGGEDVATWEIVIPATLTAGQTDEVLVRGSWAPNDILSVTANEEMKLYYNGDENGDYVTVPVTYNDIALRGSYAGAVSKTETVVVDDVNLLDAIKFGSWEGTLNFDVSFNTDSEYESGRVNDIVVSTTEELVDKLENAEAGDVVVVNGGYYELTENIETIASIAIKEGADVTIAMNSYEITSNATKPTIYNAGNLTIEGGTIENTYTGKSIAAINNVGGELTLKDCVIGSTLQSAEGDYAVIVRGGHVTLEDCTITSARGGIGVANDASVTVIGGSIAAGKYYPVYLEGEGTATFNGVTLTKNVNKKGQYIVYNAMNSGTATFTDCEFVNKNSADIPVSNDYTGITVTDCTYTKVTAPSVSAE